LLDDVFHATAARPSRSSPQPRASKRRRPPRRSGCDRRTLGSEFVATGVLAAAIELLCAGDVDMYSVEAGDLTEMSARAARVDAAEDGR
jgi:hypothetical protein